MKFVPTSSPAILEIPSRLASRRASGTPAGLVGSLLEDPALCLRKPWFGYLRFFPTCACFAVSLSIWALTSGGGP